MTDEEQQKLNARWRSTPAMRARIRELSRPDSDDYDKAVIAVLDDFEDALAQSDAEPQDMREALADKRALEIRLAEQKKFNELLAEELKQTNRSLRLAKRNAIPNPPK